MNLRATEARNGRGRGSLPGLSVVRALPTALTLVPAAILGIAACSDASGERPSVEPVSDYREPVVESGAEGEEVVRNLGPRERLEAARGVPDRERLTLLFLDGRAASPMDDGGSAWGDLDGDRVVIFDDRGRVREILQGAVEDGPPLTDPLAVWSVDGEFRVEERDGSSVLFPTDGPPHRIAGGGPAPVVGGSGSVGLAARSVLRVPLAAVPDDAPLLWRMEEGAEPRPLGRARYSSAPDPLLGTLENSGWGAPVPGGEGGAYFASALYPELLRFDGDGEVRWTATWRPEVEVEPPRFEAEDGSLQTRFSVLQHGVVRGPDGRIYVLAAPEAAGRGDRLLVFTREGVLLRETRVPPRDALFVNPRGALYVVSKEEALARTPEADRAPFRPFDRAALEGEGRVALEDFEGRVMVVNFWASWCPPCRREMPLLDDLSRELDPEEAVVVGLNDDVRSGDALAFLDEIGGVSYVNAAGEGDLARTYNYRGLPYTVILDREHRIAHTFYGFGSTLDPIREAVFEELGRGGER